MRPIIFLDIDGVMNSSDSLMQYRTDKRFSEYAVLALDWLARETKAKIIISSTWRRAFTLNKIRGYFENNLVLAKISGKTPVLSTRRASGLYIDVTRGMEIRSWLDAHAGQWDKFVIIDDDDDMEPYKDKLIQTNPNVGLTRQDAKKAMELLNHRVVSL